MKYVSIHFFYAPIFEEIARRSCEGILLWACSTLPVCHTFLVSKISNSKEPLEFGSWNFAGSLEPMTWFNFGELWIPFVRDDVFQLKHFV